MSCHCRLTQVSNLLRGLSVMAQAKGDAWVSVAFTATHMILHHVADDQSATATATMPRELFVEFSASPDCMFMVSLANLIAALQLAAHTAAATAPPVLFAYPNADGKCVIDVAESDVSVTCALLTRPVRSTLLDLRFDQALCVNALWVRGDIPKELLADVHAMHPDHVQIAASAEGFRINAIGGLHGALSFDIASNADGVLRFECTDDRVQPKFLAGHVLHALGGAGHGREAWFDRVGLRVNAASQLCVEHMGREHEADVKVTFVLQPLSTLLDL